MTRACAGEHDEEQPDLCVALASILASFACSSADRPIEAGSSQDELTLAEVLHQRGGHVLVLADGPTTFAMARFSPARNRCRTQQNVGLNCVVYQDCPDTHPTPYDAGKVSVTSGPASFELNPNANHDYTQFYDETAPSGILQPTVSVSAAGSNVPAFSITSTFPNPIVLTSPLVRDASDVAQRITLDGTQPFPIAWSGGTGWVGVQVDTMSATYGALVTEPDGTTYHPYIPLNSSYIDCLYPAAAGHAAIPAAAIAMLPKGSETTYDPAAPIVPGVVFRTHTFSVGSESHKTTYASAPGKASMLVDLTLAPFAAQSGRVTVK